MVSRLSLIAGALASLTLAGSAAAQLQSFTGNVDRKLAQCFLYTQDGGFNVHGLIAIHYGAPEWKGEYTGMVKEAKPGTRARLGKDFWTTLDTSCTLMAGDTKIAPGTYYVGVEMAEEGKMHMVLLDATKIRASGMNPAQTGQTEGGIRIPMTLKTDAEEHHELDIAIETSEDDPKHLAMIVRWGPMAAKAKVTADIEA
ncbi:MAG: hypothetical protein AAF628_11265 [Planctomycetota bacterium]